MDPVSRALMAITSCTRVDQLAAAQRYMSLALRRHETDWPRAKVTMFARLARAKSRARRRRLSTGTTAAAA